MNMVQLIQCGHQRRVFKHLLYPVVEYSECSQSTHDVQGSSLDRVARFIKRFQGIDSTETDSDSFSPGSSVTLFNPTTDVSNSLGGSLHSLHVAE